MLIKSPLKERKIRPNKRKESANKKSPANIKDSLRNQEVNYGKRANKKNKGGKRISLPSLKPWKVITAAIVIGALGILYLSHVFATQKLLQQVHQLERTYNQAKRVHNDYRLQYDRMIGPAEIYKKAKKRGFINGGPAERIIKVKPK